MFQPRTSRSNVLSFSENTSVLKSAVSSANTFKPSLKFGQTIKNGQKVLGSGKKRSLSEALDTKCNIISQRPRKKANVDVPLAVKELKAEQKGAIAQVKLGMHPALLKKDHVNQNLKRKIRRVEEMVAFWKRKSLHLAKDLDKSRTEITMLREKLETVESERLQIQDKLLSAQQDNSQCMKAIKSLMSENDDLKFTMGNMSQELKELNDSKAEELDKCDISMIDADAEEDQPTNMETCKELEEALEDTLADLTDRIDEIEELKSALAKTTVERDQLQQVVSREVIQYAIAEMQDEDQSPSTNPTARRIAKLQEQVEKCMFRIAVLTQKNEELRKVAKNGSDDTDLLKTLEDSQKLEVLESLCMQKYRKLLRKTAAKIVETGEFQDLANESFNVVPTEFQVNEQDYGI